MMRTIEVLIVIIILTGAFLTASYYTVLPLPRQISPINLRRLALTTLQTLDSNYSLSTAAFDTNNTSLWGGVQGVLSASLPPNVLYNLTVYNMGNGGSGAEIYDSLTSISNAASLGITSDASSDLVASQNVTFNVVPQKIGENGGGTLYILNCSDSNGWWITGYTISSLAQNLYSLLSPYFVKIIMVQNTDQLGQILNGTALQGETVQNAVIINTNGEAVPIPAGYYSSPGVGYDSSQSSYAPYSYTLGQRVLQYNWTWVSIVGYPLYYVSNTGLFSNNQNTWGIYGMMEVGAAGFNAFLQGLNDLTYSYNPTWITGSPAGVVYLSSQALYNCNYYGLYPSPYQTATRALPVSITSAYNLNITSYVFNTTPDGWNPGAVYRHTIASNGVTSFQGGFFALGMTRMPDVRLTALGLLGDFAPRLYGSDYTAYGTSRLVVLQLGLVGGV